MPQSWLTFWFPNCCYFQSAGPTYFIWHVLGGTKTLDERAHGYHRRHPALVRDEDGPMDSPSGCCMGGSQNTDREARVKRRVQRGTSSEQDQCAACAGLEEVGSRHSNRQFRLAGWHERTVSGSVEAGGWSVDMEGAHDVEGWLCVYRRVRSNGGFACSEESAMIVITCLGLD